MNSERKNMKRKKKMMRKQQEDELFPLILSALLRKSHNNETLIKKCLNQIFLSIPHLLSTPILSLLPALLKSNFDEIASRSAEIIGAACLISIEMNEKIAGEDEIVKGLISLLGSSKRQIAMAACNAVLDLSTASIGRQRLLEFSAIDNLFLCFIQSSKTSAETISLKEDGYQRLLIQATIPLINSCTIDQLHRLQVVLSRTFLAYLKGLWQEAHKQRLRSRSSVCNGGKKDFYASGIKINNLAESIFRLSINYCSYPEAIAFDTVEESILDFGDISLQQFLSTIWELSPMLVRDDSKASSGQNDIFSPFMCFLGSEEAIPTHLPSMLKHFISCPPIPSDELDVLHFMEETKNNLGFPIIYNQDIRVLKTKGGEKEIHYFQEKYKSTHILDIDEILRCGEAFQEGYSVAVRGMEFRFPALSAIADGIASFFGQPSVGVNMYLTPPNSQGLIRHTDDHCVFVCQLVGYKRWTVYPRPNIQLPRLYESLDSSEADSKEIDGCQQILLKRGDALYIPRGFPHEARTYVDDHELNGTTGFSLHLTLAVEIEPPFEWEGFMQIAVYTWFEKQKSIQYTFDDSLQWSLNVKLLHVAVKLSADLDPTFRKACLIGARSISSSITGQWFSENQKTIFQYLIHRILNKSNFSDAVRYLEAALQKNEDPLEHMRWIKSLTVEGEIRRFYDSNTSLPDSRYFLDLLNQHRNRVETSFMQVKSKFCREVGFHDVEQRYMLLLERYRKVRKQYTNGMLSLHCTLDNKHDRD